MTRQLCIVLHDVAPATWPQCARLLDLVDGLGGAPVTLLVVPDFHGTGRIDAAPDFRRAIEERLQRGDELALHGYAHRDEAPPPRNPFDWLRRCVLTDREGEFSALTRAQAHERIARGLELFANLRWPVAGFVAPAWLAGSGTYAALRGSGLRYTSTHGALIALPDGARLAAPCLTASPRSRWRRTVSKRWLRAGAALTSQAGVVRIGLHPQDALHDDLMACWKHVLARLLAQREAVTKTRAFETLIERVPQHA